MMAGSDSSAWGLMFQQAVGQRLGLGATDMKCLDVIARNGPATPSQLTKLTGLTSGAVTILLDRLEKSGLIERKADAKDRRKTLLVPTRKCMKQVAPSYSSMIKAMFELNSAYSRSELEFLEEHFKKVSVLFKHETEKLTATRKSPGRRSRTP